MSLVLVSLSAPLVVVTEMLPSMHPLGKTFEFTLPAIADNGPLIFRISPHNWPLGCYGYHASPPPCSLFGYCNRVIGHYLVSAVSI